ncbi:MAG: Dna2/Cas4 domain-containing protein [Chloroflexi bacterium]|nr:Dna2/Cas4 domain-containing protein [Chloroflexota bacterium]
MGLLGWLGLALLLAGAGLLWWARRRWGASGLPPAQVVAADRRGWRRPAQPYYSARWGLTGRPDYVLRQGARLIPVELKSGGTPAQPYAGHLLQLAAYCLLLEEAEGQPPPYGLLCYPQATFRVPFDRRMRAQLLAALEALQGAAPPGGLPRGHRDAQRCAACSYGGACDQRLEA